MLWTGSSCAKHVPYPLNFPPSLRKLSGSFFLTRIIPGPKEAPKNTDPYLELVMHKRSENPLHQESF